MWLVASQREQWSCCGQMELDSRGCTKIHPGWCLTVRSPSLNRKRNKIMDIPFVKLKSICFSLCVYVTMYFLVKQDDEMPADLSSMDASGVTESLRIVAEVVNQSGGKLA